MKTKISLLLGCAMIIFVSGCGSGDNPFAGPTGSVRGFVVDEGTGKGIAGVSVVCGQDSAMTDSKGQFVIDNSDTGLETVTATASGYMGIGNETTQVTVVENSNVDAGTLRLAKLTDGYVNLTDLTPNAFNDIRIGSLTIKSQTWDKSILGATELKDNDAVAIYSINGKFAEFRATAGVDDASTYVLETYKFLVYVDGALASEVNRMRGESTDIAVSVTGATEIRLEIRCSDSDTGRAGGYFAGFGNARLIP